MGTNSWGSGAFLVSGLVLSFLATASCSGIPSATCVSSAAGANATDPCASGGAGATGGATSSGGNSAFSGGTTNKSSATGGSATGGAVSGGTTSAAGAVSGGTTSAGGGTASCATDTQAAPLGSVNLFILLDKSGSMGDDPNGQWANAATRWNPVVQTLDAFVNDPGSNRLNAALILMPANGNNTAMCTASNYTSGGSAVNIPLTLLDPAGRQQFLSRLCDPSQPQTPPCIVPAGGTPTRPALQGTISYAAQASQSNPNSKSVIVFLTDGEPGFGVVVNSSVYATNSCDDLTNGCVPTTGTGCTTADQEVSNVAAVIATAPARSVYLVATGDLTLLTIDTWAAASGNPAISLVSEAPTQAAATLRAALHSIRSNTISCSFQIPTPTSGSVDPTKLNVSYIDGTGNTQTMRRTSDGTSSTCSGSAYGWYFDDPTAPRAVNLCSSTCNALQQDAQAKVEVVFGCTTLIF